MYISNTGRSLNKFNNQELYMTFSDKKDYPSHSTGAQKDTLGKLRFDLIPPEVLIALAEVYTFGMMKYAARNWENGLLLEEHHGAAMMRHFTQWRMRKDYDPESALNHLKHALFHLAAMITQIERGRTDLDDRVRL
jgi:hypothetical protein